MTTPDFPALMAQIEDIPKGYRIGRVRAISGGTVTVSGLNEIAHLGDIVEIETRHAKSCRCEVISMCDGTLTVLADGLPEGMSVGVPVRYLGALDLAPDSAWLGRVVDPFGAPLDGRPLMRGAQARGLRATPPEATARRPLGARLNTGLAAFNTFLPLVRGQRLGLFAGSGVGKSMLLANLARNVDADVAVIALIGERGREVREFVEHTLGPEGMARAVVVVATSDQPALVRRRAVWAAMTIAEHFRDEGQHVLFLADSITRFAEAHRELALSAGEPASLRGFPPSTSQTVMALAERAGPGLAEQGDITAIFSVLVAGSDMEEPIADIMRGVLDGHIVLDRQIAERGRFPAIDLLRSVSRSLPHAASGPENALISRARALLGSYERAELMIQSGLYTAGSDPEIDAAIQVWPHLDAFLAETDHAGCDDSFARLASCLEKAGPMARPSP